MKKVLYFFLISLVFSRGFSQNTEIKPNQGVSVPQFTTTFISSMTTQPKGTVVFDKDLNVLKYWDGTNWQTASGGGTNYWTLSSNVLSSSYPFFGLYGGTNITPLVSGNGDDGTLSISSPNSLFTISKYLTFDGNSIQARQNNIFLTNPKSERTLRLNPFGGNVGIGTGTSTLTSNLLVLKSTSGSFDGSAVFKGTTHFSHFHYGTNEDTYIRGGKDGSHVIINDAPLGNVGIGVYPSTYKLEVNGTTRSKEVIVETGWADYVFDESYKLKSIEELEAFVKENKHLPNIPKASDIEKGGLKVGETNKAMMEKIEELALYIIQLKKEIDILKSKN